MAKGQKFGGFAGGNMQSLMRQAQKMQEQLEKSQEELDLKEYEASSGGGAVSCRVSGRRELLSLSIKPEAVDPEEVDLLEDLILAAVNEALRAEGEARKKAMEALAPGGLGGLL